MIKLTRGERFSDARAQLPAGKNSMDDVAEATGVSKSLIQALENDNSNRDVGYSKIVLLAKYYGVSVDYLLTLTDTPSPDPIVREICEYTGLSPDAVSLLHWWSSWGDLEEVRTVNLLLENIQYDYKGYNARPVLELITLFLKFDPPKDMYYLINKKGEISQHRPVRIDGKIKINSSANLVTSKMLESTYTSQIGEALFLFKKYISDASKGEKSDGEY